MGKPEAEGDIVPYHYGDETYDRVSEWLNSLECEQTAHLLKHGDPKRPRETHAVVIVGTFGHHNIDAYIRKKMGIEKPRPLRLNVGFKHILKNWREKGIYQQRLVIPLQQMMANFDHFWNTYDITPIFVEKRLFHKFKLNGKQYKLAGTVDLIARIKLKGTVSEDNEFKQCIHVLGDPMCQCEVHDVVTLIDWKFSLRPHKNHPIQLSTYRWMAKETKVLEQATQHGKYPLNAENWSVLLKNKSGMPEHQLHKYKQDMGDFFEAAPIMDDPRPLPYSTRTGSMGFKMRCGFCADRISCTDVGIWTPEDKYDEPGAVVVDNQ